MQIVYMVIATVSSFCTAPQQVKGVLKHPEIHARYVNACIYVYFGEPEGNRGKMRERERETVGINFVLYRVSSMHASWLQGCS